MLYFYIGLVIMFFIAMLAAIRYKEKYHNFRNMVSDEQKKNALLREKLRELKFEHDTLAYRYAKLLDEKEGKQTQSVPLSRATVTPVEPSQAQPSAKKETLRITKKRFMKKTPRE